MTQIFLDTANINEIKYFLDLGIGEGVTTNQKIFLSEGSIDFRQRVLDICNLRRDWPVSIETTTKTFTELLSEARLYAGWHRNVVVKVAIDKDGVGLRVVKRLHDEGIKTNATAMVTFNQLYLAAAAGATYVSLFFNRARDAGLNPVRTIEKIVPVLERNTQTQLICGSIRNPDDIEEIVSAGAHVATIPSKILLQMPFHAKTEETIEEFDQAWRDFLAASEPGRAKVNVIASNGHRPKTAVMS